MTQGNICVSFSGGRSSAVMTKILYDNRESIIGDLAISFVNVGCEHEATLKFVHGCQTHFGWPVVWLEPVFSPVLGEGVRHKVVTYETASRNGEPFEAYIAKHGIPGPTNPNCTNYLKEECMNAYRRDALGWKRKDYWTAIGIRSDEIDRMSPKADEKRLFYPLIKGGYTKQAVAAEIAKWPFDLEIPNDAHGNCVWCWKKSLRKLITVAQQSPEAFDFPLRMEKKYARHRQEDGQEDRRFFRKRMLASDILRLSKDQAALQVMNFYPHEDDKQLSIFDLIGYNSILDEGGGCGDSCEIGSDY